MYYVYIIKCKNGALYTGITTNVLRRFAEHNGKGGRGAKYTRSAKPESFEALWGCETRSDASRLEAHIKKLKREEKLRLIGGNEPEALPFFFERLATDKAHLISYTKERRINKNMKIVIKIGTSTLAHKTGHLNIRRIENLCKIRNNDFLVTLKLL